MTSGEYLKNLLNEKGISVTELTKKMGLKSRNMLYRLFSNRYSKERAAELAKQVAKAADISEKEMNIFLKKLEDGREIGFFSTTRSILMNLYRDTPETGYKFDLNGRNCSLNSILKCHTAENTAIMLSGIDNIRIIGDLCVFLDAFPDIHIYHYVKLRTHSVATAYEIVSVTMLMNYKNYTPLIADELLFKGICILEKEKNGCFIRRLDLMKSGNILLESHMPNSYYEYILQKREKYNQLCTTVKMPGKRVINYIEILKGCRIFDDGKIYYNEGAPCFGTLRFDIAYELLESVNWLGFPKDHPYIKEMVSITKEREETFLNTPTAKRFYLLDEAHIKNMLQTGITFDHPENFPPLDKDQLRQYFSWLLEMSEKHPEKLEIRFINIPNIRYPFVYGIDKTYYMYHSDSGFMDGFTVFINNPGVVEIMNDFMQYIWDTFTTSEAYLRQLLEEYL